MAQKCTGPKASRLLPPRALCGRKRRRLDEMRSALAGALSASADFKKMITYRQASMKMVRNADR